MSLIRPEQALALQAALLRGDDALRAFSRWCEVVPFDKIDGPSVRLVPRIYANIQALGGDSPSMGRMKGLYRRTWVDNRLKLSAVETLLRLLNANGIETILLKGIAIIVRWTPDTGLRSMDDADILVRREQMHATSACVLAAGYRSSATQLGRLTHREVDETHAVLVRSPEGLSIDLHWRALLEGRAADQDRAFWARAQPIKVADAPTHVLAAEDQLYHTCAHAASSSNGPRLDWVVDAAMVLKQVGGNFDWDRFIEHARRDHIEIPVRAFVALLRDVVHVPIPASVDRRLRSFRPKLLARADFALRRRTDQDLGASAKAFLAFQDFRRRDARLCRMPAPMAVKSFVLEHWQFDGPLSAARHGLYAALDRPVALRPMLAGQRQRLLLERPLPGQGHLDFLNAAAVDPFIFGWSAPEAMGRWTDGNEAVLAVRVAKPRPQTLPVAIRLLPFVPSEPLAVEVWAGQRQIDVWRFTPDQPGWQWKRLTIGADAIDWPAPVQIAFVIRSPSSPASRGLSLDRRLLGFCVRRAYIGYPSRTDLVDRPLDFRASSRDTEMLWSGWSTPEPTGCWTVGARASIGMRLPKLVDRDMVATLTAFPAARSGGRPFAPAVISAGGTRLAVVTPTAATGGIRFVIPKTAFDGDGSLSVDIDVPEPFVPADHGVSTDTRRLGLHVSRMTLSPKT